MHLLWTGIRDITRDAFRASSHTVAETKGCKYWVSVLLETVQPNMYFPDMETLHIDYWHRPTFLTVLRRNHLEMKLVIVLQCWHYVCAVNGVSIGYIDYCADRMQAIRLTLGCCTLTSVAYWIWGLYSFWITILRTKLILSYAYSKWVNWLIPITSYQTWEDVIHPRQEWAQRIVVCYYRGSSRWTAHY